MLMRVTENESRSLVKESVMRLLEWNGFLGGFDESAEGEEKTNDSEIQRKRNFVLDAFSNKNGKSDIKRRGAIELLFHPKDEGEWDTYRSLFSKYIDPNDTAHELDDSQINKLYNWLNDVL
jgi:hypothetical protein